MQDWVFYYTSTLGLLYSLQRLKFNKNFQGESQLSYSLTSLLLFPYPIPEYFLFCQLSNVLKICISIFLSIILVVSMKGSFRASNLPYFQKKNSCTF